MMTQLSSLSYKNNVNASNNATNETSLPVFVQPTLFKFYGNDPDTHKQQATLFNPYNFRIRFKILTTAPHKYFVAEPKGVINSKSYVELVIRVKNVHFQEEKLAKPINKDKLRIQLYRISDADDDESASSDVSSNDRNNNDKVLLIGKKDFPLIYINKRDLNAMSNAGNESSDFGEFAENDEMPYSSLSYGNNLNAIMNMNRNSMNSKVSRQQQMSNGNKRLACPNGVNKKGMMIPNYAANYINANYPGYTENVNYIVILIGLICLGILFLPLNSSINSSSSSETSRIPTYLHVSLEIKLFASFVMGMVTMVILKA